MAMQHAPSGWEPAPYTSIPDLCFKSLHPTSGYNDYENIIRFVDANPHRLGEFPDSVFRTLLIECQVDCDHLGCTCPKTHTRVWHSNIPFLKRCNKLPLATEFRVVLYNKCELPLHLDKELDKMAKQLPLVLPNVHTIMFLGYGVFTPEAVSHSTIYTTDADVASRTIQRLFPRVADLRSHVSRIWGPTPNLISQNTDMYPLFGYLFKAYAARLWHVQMLIPFPLNVASLFEFLTSISINVQYVRPREDLPRIPIQRLRILELFRIDSGIPWWLFMAVGGMHTFESLEDLRLEFIRAADRTAEFPDSYFLVLFPRLNRLHITGAAYVYTDIRGYFKDRHLDSLTIVDDPADFMDTSENALENVRVLKIGHRAGTPNEDRHSEEAVERLYNLPSSAEEATLRFVDYPLPQRITWVNLRSLGMSVSIADKCRVANLVRQLPRLNRLAINCFSMLPADAKNTRFPDQKDVPKLLKDALKPSNRTPISQSLVHLELMVRGSFDTYGFSELLSRLPQVTYVKTNNDKIPSIIDFLARDFMGHRDIHYFGWR